MPARSNQEIVQSLQTLLRVRTPEAEIEPEIIITAAPHVWSDPDIVRDAILIDLQDLLGVRTPWPSVGPRVSNSFLEDEVYRALLATEWPEELIHREYRPDYKTAVVMDFALCNEAGEVIAAIEVQGQHLIGTASADAQARRILNLSTAVEYVFVTDSQQYQLFRRDGETSLSSNPPRPIDIGVHTRDLVADSSRRLQSAMRPASGEALASIVAEHAPKSIIIDFSLPWGHRTSASSLIRTLLPGAVADQVRGAMESNQILLAWAASLESVQWVSAVTQPSTVWATGTQWLRDWLATRLGLKAHIELPPAIFAPATNISGSFVLLGGHGDRAYFDTLTNPGDLVGLRENNWFMGFEAWLRGESANPGYDKSTASLESWAVRTNDPQAEQTRVRLANLGETVLLGEISDVFMGMNVPRGDTMTEPEGDASLIVDGRQLRAGPDDDVEPRYLPMGYEIRERDRLQAGDILLPRVFTPSTRAVVHSGDNPAVAGTSVIVIRPMTSDVSSDYLAEFINSTSGTRLVGSISAGTTVPQISIGSLRELPIPIIDIDLDALSEIDGIRDQLSARADELESRRRALFDSKNKDELSTKLKDLQWRSDLITKTLRLTESLEFQISQFFPFPLAYSYRLLASYVDPFRRYQEQLRVAENILAFLGSTALALLDDADRASLQGDLEGYWRGGISPGHWRDMTARCAGMLKRYEGNPLASHFSQLNAGSDKKGIGKELQLLVTAKNDFKHDRGPKVEQDVVDHSRKLQESLERCMKLLAFWTQHPIRRVQDFDKPRRQTRFNLRCLRLVGDHPGFQQEDVKWHAALTRHDLYVEVEKRFWVPLFPFVQVLNCPKCKSEETYYIDKWDTDRGIVTMKSFERGHTEESSETATELHTRPGA